MLNPIRLVNNIFDDERLSDSNLRMFTEDHLLRLNNNNPGSIYSTLIANTATKYTAYYGKMSSEHIQTQVKEGLTVSKKEARDAVETKVSSLQGLVKFKFGETSSEYQEFFPQGMNAFYQAKDGDLEILLDGFQASAVTFLTADFPAQVTEVTTLITAYKNAFSAQNNAFSLIDNIITDKQEDRTKLTEQLTQNFLIIASNNISNPNKFDDYYDPAYLPITSGPETFNGTINTDTIINGVPDGHITRSSNLLLKNNGPDDLVFSLSETPGTIEPVPNQIIVAAGQQHRFTEPLPVLEHYYLNIQNPSTTENGSWHVEVS